MSIFKRFIHALKHAEPHAPVYLMIRQNGDGFELISIDDGLVRAVVPTFSQAKDLQLQMLLPEALR